MTDVQGRILAWLADTVSTRGFRPTVREMCKAFGWRSPNTAMEHMRRMRRDGLVEYQDKMARTMAVTQHGAELLEELRQEAKA